MQCHLFICDRLSGHFFIIKFRCYRKVAVESHFHNGAWKGRRSRRVAKLIVWKRKRRCNDRASRGRKKGGWGGNKKAKYVTIEQVALLEVGRQELISGLGKL